MKPKIIPIIIILVLPLLVPVTQTVLEASGAEEQQVRSGQAEKILLDRDYWVLIRNVAIPDHSGKTVRRGLDVLVVGTSIHKIGSSPMLLFDKDLTYNFDGEGRIALSFMLQEQVQASARTLLGVPEAGTSANIILIEAREMAELQLLTNEHGWIDLESMAEHGETRLIIESGVVTHDTLPGKRIDRSRLGNYQSNQ